MKFKSEVTLCLSGAYPEQNFLYGEVLDLRNLEGSCCYCCPETRETLTGLLDKYPSEGLHWIDSGDYHYLSLLWMRKHSFDFALLLFDHHPDDQDCAFGEDLLSCGSWMKEAAALPHMKTSLTLGLDANAPSQKLVGWLEDLPEGLPLHISIDKDVLSEQYARTNWDQGTMPLPELLSLLRLATLDHPVAAVDICGELSVSKGACAEDVDINVCTNRILRNFFLNLRR